MPKQTTKKPEQTKTQKAVPDGNPEHPQKPARVQIKRKANKKPSGKPITPRVDLYQNLSPDNPRHARVFRFIDEYCIDFNGTQAAIRAGYSEKGADSVASQMLSNARIAELVAQKKKEIGERNGVDQDYTIQRWRALTEVDTNELVEYRRCCCRYCWGTDFAYQETIPEFKERQRLYVIENERAEEQGKGLPIWDDTIELGFIGNKDPNPDCPACWGEGVGHVHFNDTRKLSEQAKVAYAGAKVGKDGIEIKIHSRKEALDSLSRYVGLYEKDNNGKISLEMDAETLTREFVKRMDFSRTKQRAILVERGLADED